MGFGDNTLGQFGGPKFQKYSIEPVKIDFSEPIEMIKSGGKFTSILTKNGDYYNTGSNEHGQLGIGHYSDNKHGHVRFKKIYHSILYIENADNTSYIIDRYFNLHIAGKFNQNKSDNRYKHDQFICFENVLTVKAQKLECIGLTTKYLFLTFNGKFMRLNTMDHFYCNPFEILSINVTGYNVSSYYIETNKRVYNTLTPVINEDDTIVHHKRKRDFEIKKK